MSRRVATVDVETHADDDEVAEYQERGRQLVDRGEVEAARMARAMRDLVAANDGGLPHGHGDHVRRAGKGPRHGSDHTRLTHARAATMAR